MPRFILLTFALMFFIITGMGSVSMAGDNEFQQADHWSVEDKKVIRSLSLSSLPPLPSDPSNAYADNPKAIEFGKKLFFDIRFSANGKISCATCHIPGYSFTDRLPRARGMGATTRRTMPLIGVAYQSWFFWDGRKDSLWSQAIGPIESVSEHGVTRSFCAHLIMTSTRENTRKYSAVPRR